MPMVNSNQARIQLSGAQAEAVVVLVQQNPEVPMIYIEETNLGSTVVVGGKGMPTTLVDHYGDIYQLREHAYHKAEK